MSERKTGLVPRLRFPEFREAGEWERKRLDQVATLYKGKGISKSDITSDGNQPCIRYGELYTVYEEVIEDVISKTKIQPKDLFLSNKGDVIIPASGETKIDIATAACVKQGNVALGGDLNIIRSEQNGIFLSYFLNGALRFEIAKVAQGDTVVHLYKNQLEQLHLAFPTQAEQQKIACCLSSLDALIAAHADKLDALKTHKKGLMQQLFPREGETVPRLRFPEFREAGEWEEKKLSELFAFRNGLNADKEKYGKGHKYISVLDIISGKPITYDSIHSSVEITEKELELFKVEYGDIVFQRSSETQDEAGQASVYLDRKKAAIFGGFVIRGKRISDYHPLFMSALLASAHVRKEISSHSAGSTRYNIGQETLSVIAVLIPSLPEQQKIAACLCSLDALITAQAEKIEALKTNKKGLMQQLFPSPEA